MTDEEILKRLETERPSRELNRLLAKASGWHRVTPSKGGGKYGGWIAPEDFLGTHSDGAPILDGLHGTDIRREPPDFTGSLDAKLPGENIVSTGLAREKWQAVNKDKYKNYIGGTNPHSEAMSRRAAAWRSRMER